MGIGKNIRLLREINGISQAKLAKMLYVTPQAVSRWEKDITEPDMVNSSISKIFDISTSSIEIIAFLSDKNL